MIKKNSPLIGFLGGTFDPIHFGHLRLALVLYQALQLREIRFIPCQQPVLKDRAKTSATHRLAMLKLAIAKQRGFVVDDRELQRTTPSYTFDTLRSLREELGQKSSICWIIGSDAFSDFTRWYRWQEILKLAHLIIVHRPGFQIPKTGPVAEMLQQNQIDHPQGLTIQSAGCLLLHPFPALEIASRDIRHQLNHQLSPRYLLPDTVLRYIKQHQLYTQSI